MIKQGCIKREELSYLKISVAAVLQAIAVNFIFLHDGLAPGGLTGLSLVLSTLFGASVETMLLIVSIPLLLVSVKVLGGHFGVKTLFVTFLTPVIMKILPKSIWLTGSLATIHPVLEWLVGGVIGGILVGASVAIAVNQGAATGGTDVMALLLQKIFKQVPLSRIILILDGLITLATGMINKNYMLTLFSLWSLLIISRIIGRLVKKG